MNILVIGAGGVGSSIAAIAERRSFFDRLTVADISLERAQAVVDHLDDDGRFGVARVDASSPTDVVETARACRADVIVNACDPRLNPRSSPPLSPPAARYIDMAMSLSAPHPDRPYEETGVKLGDDQFAMAEQFEAAGLLALVGHGRRARACPTSSLATPPTTSSTRSTRSASATAPTCRSTATSSRRRSPSGRPSRSA